MRLELRGISKRFGALVANDRIDLTVEPGEIHALLGENGAGKSTLMNVLYGLLQPDEGEILVNDEVRHFKSPGDAIAAGIGMVHQHFMLVPVFSVTENIMLGAEQTKGGPVGLLNRRSARAHVLEVSQRYGLPVDPDATLVEELVVVARDKGPAWWTVSNGTSTVYVLGAPSLAPKRTPWDTTTLERRLQGANEVILPFQDVKVKAKGSLGAAWNLMRLRSGKPLIACHNSPRSNPPNPEIPPPPPLSRRHPSGISAKAASSSATTESSTSPRAARAHPSSMAARRSRPTAP